MKVALPDGTKLYFDIHGSERKIQGAELIEKPTLLFLHGGPGLADHNLYAPFWSTFQDVAQVVFLDMRGHGQSDGWNQKDKFNLKTWGQDVKDFCDQLGIKKPIVVGFSFGGWVALEYAIQHPEHPGALILCNTEAKIDVQTRAEAYRDKALRKGFSQEKSQEIYETVIKLGTGQYDSKDTAQIYLETCAPLFSEKSNHPDEEKIWALCKQNPLAWEIFDTEEQFDFDHTPNLHKIKAPTLCISGELDVEHPATCAKAMCEKMISAKARHVILKNAGDPVDHDDPEGTARAVRNFIFEVSQKGRA